MRIGGFGPRGPFPEDVVARSPHSLSPGLAHRLGHAPWLVQQVERI
ncbi:MAG: hypothetical protein ACYC0E_07070 [Acidimicrobiales bacterium]